MLLGAVLSEDVPARQSHFARGCKLKPTSLELAIENCLRRSGGKISHRYSFGNLISRKSPRVSTYVRLGLVA